MGCNTSQCQNGEDTKDGPSLSYDEEMEGPMEHKVVLLGDVAVGKSSLVLRFTKNMFSDRHQATIGAAFATKEMVIGEETGAGGRKVVEKRRIAGPGSGKPGGGSSSSGPEKAIRLQIWDTAGEEKYRAMTRFYYRNCAAGLIVYDITNHRSFDKLDEWTREFRDHCPAAVIVIAGNKLDMEDQRQVLKRDAESYCESRGLIHIEVGSWWFLLDTQR